MGDSEIETILKRLDRLTQEEARMTAAQTLAVVHSLLDNMKVVMNGESSRLENSKPDQIVVCVGGEASTKAIRQTLGTSCQFVNWYSQFLGLMEHASYHPRGC